MATSKRFIFVKRENGRVYYKPADPIVAAIEIPPLESQAEIASTIPYFEQNVEGYQPPAPTPLNGSTVSGNGTPQGPQILKDRPHDPRLVYISGVEAGKDILSFTAAAFEPLVDGFVFSSDPSNPDGKKVAAQNLDDISQIPGVYAFSGVPSLMNPNAYISFQTFKADKGSSDLSLLIDQPNQPRWYEIDQYNSQRGHRYKAPSVTEIVNWSREESNADKTPYRFQDFAYCKYWQKIPNNYLVTLRRYPFPTSDNLEAAGENHPKGGKIDGEKLRPVATAVTWLGESTGNKISSILGGFQSGLNWKEIKSEMNVVSPASPADAGAGPFSGIAKWVGMIGGDYEDTQNLNRGTPPDPYTEGPWQNKVIGNVNVIDSVKARERGLVFKHDISLVFEYSARSIGGVNSKAAMLDIMSNLLVLTSASATFWGGANRFRPGSPGNTAPFLGGPKGRRAFMDGDPVGFLNSVTEQFAKGAGAISDFLFNANQNTIETLKSLLAGGAKAFMGSTMQSKSGYVTGIKAILTGEPVGEWHLTVGNPFNPMMLIGNLICTGIKIEFNDELGPDDFPTELKATITLEHGMPRDRDAIESMFNGGGGRLYSLPAGYEKSFSSSAMTPVDKYTTKKENGEGDTGVKKPGGTAYVSRGVLFGDPSDTQRAVTQSKNTVGKTYSNIAAKWGMGFAKSSPKA